MKRCMIIILAMGLAGCGNGFGPDALHLEIQPAAAAFPHDGPFTFGITARNDGDEPITWGQGSSSCQLEAFVRVDGQDYRFASRVCTSDLAPQGLEPGASRTERLLFEGQYFDGTTPVPLPPGEYEFRGAAGDVARSRHVKVEIRAAG